ncbi:monocarboxylate transporter 14 [Caerostris extrusa]|uniref:Monocarboxylate transporter 14 n=1 Tax=Caerostris extrusa TaxID=172846 RepID=A0AAV4TE97_CAEEX|nr:monocarboxylate transporter 14 [Caerostris extrusa]
MGISNTIGKVIFGLWADKGTCDVLTLYAGCLLVCGVPTMMVSLMTDYYHLAVYSVVLGLAWGGSISLSTIVLVNLLGMNKLSNAYGLYLLSIGVATITGPPLTAVLHDMTSNYGAGFYLSGGSITIGALILFTIPSIRRRFPQQMLHNP